MTTILGGAPIWLPTEDDYRWDGLRFLGWTADVPDFEWPDTEPCWARVVNGR